MKTFGIVSYNIHCNFTNYGSALQSWALSRAIERLGFHAKLVDYCPEVLKDADPLNPFKLMWDRDAESRRLCELSLPAIRENYAKFDRFYRERFDRTARTYTAANFGEVVADEGLDGFVCGSDTIFCIDEFKGFDDGYYANYPCMQGRSVAYAASFGDAHFSPADYATLNRRLANFKAIGIREYGMLDYVRAHCGVRAERTIDPTLLAEASLYEPLVAEPQMREKYLLYYSRRYNPAMERYAERLAKRRGLTFVEISLRAANADKGHILRYDAGVEEFLSLVRHAEAVVTNSFHGIIFAVQLQTPFFCFSREQGDSKIGEVLDIFGLKDRLMIDGTESVGEEVDFDAVHRRIAEVRKASSEYLEYALELLK